MPVLNGKHIQSIIAAGLTYLDEQAVERFIDFEECFQNHLAERLSARALQRVKEANGWDNDRLERYKRELVGSKDQPPRFRMIGERQPMSKPFADGPYIEFYSQPPIHFDFDTAEEYEQARNKIFEVGWHTFDRS